MGEDDYHEGSKTDKVEMQCLENMIDNMQKRTRGGSKISHQYKLFEYICKNNPE